MKAVCLNNLLKALSVRLSVACLYHTHLDYHTSHLATRSFPRRNIWWTRGRITKNSLATRQRLTFNHHSSRLSLAIISSIVNNSIWGSIISTFVACRYCNTCTYTHVQPAILVLDQPIRPDYPHYSSSPAPSQYPPPVHTKKTSPDQIWICGRGTGFGAKFIS